MPLKKSARKEAVGENIKRLRQEQYPQEQAVAIALDVQRRARDKASAHAAKVKKAKRKGTK